MPFSVTPWCGGSWEGRKRVMVLLKRRLSQAEPSWGLGGQHG